MAEEFDLDAAISEAVKRPRRTVKPEGDSFDLDAAIASEVKRPPAPYEEDYPFLADVGNAVGDAKDWLRSKGFVGTEEALSIAQQRTQARIDKATPDNPPEMLGPINMDAAKSAGELATASLGHALWSFNPGALTYEMLKPVGEDVSKKLTPEFTDVPAPRRDVIEQAMADTTPKGLPMVVGGMLNPIDRSIVAPAAQAVGAQPPGDDPYSARDMAFDPFGTVGAAAASIVPGVSPIIKGKARARLNKIAPPAEVPKSPRSAPSPIVQALADETGGVPVEGVKKALDPGTYERALDKAGNAVRSRTVDAAAKWVADKTKERFPRVERAMRSFFDPDGNKPREVVELFEMMSRAKATWLERTYKLERDMSRTIGGAAKKAAPRGERKLLEHDLMNDLFDLRVGESVSPSDLAQRLAKENPGWYSWLDELGRQAVEVGLLPEEVRAQNAGSYLPYYYPEGAITALRNVVRGELVDGSHSPKALNRLLGQSEQNMGRLKGRSKALTYEERVNDLKLIRDPVYATVRGMLEISDLVETRRLQNMLAEHPDVIPTLEGRNKIRDAQGELNRVRERGGDVATLEADLSKAREAGPMTGDVPGYKRLPEDQRYGPLDGAYVPEDWFQDIVDTVEGPVDWERAGAAKTLLMAYTKTFKTSAVGLNPAIYPVAWMGNHIQADLIGGFPLHRHGQFLMKAAQDMRGARKWVEQAVADGAMDGGYLNAETFKVLDMLGDTVAHADIVGGKTGPSKAMWSTALLMANMAKGVKSGTLKAASAYSVIDQAWKLAHYIYKREVLGRDGLTAAKEAQRAHFDYRRLPRWVKSANRWYAPFSSFVWKASTIAPEVVARHPVRATKWIAAFQAADAIGHAMSEGEAVGWGFSEEAREQRGKERQGMNWLQKRSAVRMPFKVNDKAVEFTADRVLEWATGRETDNSTLSNPVSAAAEIATVGNPAIVGGVEWIMNQDSFTGEKIYEPEAPAHEQAFDVAWHYFKPLIPRAMSWGKSIYDTADGRTYYGEELGLGEAALYRTLPLKPQNKFFGSTGRALETRGQFRDAMSEGRRELRKSPDHKRDEIRERLRKRVERIKERHRKHRDYRPGRTPLDLIPGMTQ